MLVPPDSFFFFFFFFYVLPVVPITIGAHLPSSSSRPSSVIGLECHQPLAANVHCSRQSAAFSSFCGKGAALKRWPVRQK